MATGFIQTLHPLKDSRGQPGTTLTHGDCTYVFAANAYGHYVAEVLDEGHYAAILSIGAGYQPYTPPTDVPAAPVVAQAPTSREAPYSKAPDKQPRASKPAPAAKPAPKRHTEALAVDPAAG